MKALSARKYKVEVCLFSLSGHWLEVKKKVEMRAKGLNCFANKLIKFGKSLETMHKGVFEV